MQMLIKGIRSFSPDNTAVVEFYRPLTLIVGHNGAGKTVSFGFNFKTASSNTGLMKKSHSGILLPIGELAMIQQTTHMLHELNLNLPS